MVYVSRFFVPASSGISAGDLEVGKIVRLNEKGTPVDYLVVNQGIPEDSPLYDASCEGTWLLRKDISENRIWDSGPGAIRYPELAKRHNAFEVRF